MEEHKADVNNHLKSLFIISNDGTMIKYIIEHKAKVYQIEEVYLVKYLVEHKAEVNYKNYYREETPLMIAYKNNNEMLVKYLVEHGVNINKQDKNGRTALGIIHSKNNKTIKNYFIRHWGFLGSIYSRTKELFYI